MEGLLGIPLTQPKEAERLTVAEVDAPCMTVPDEGWTLSTAAKEARVKPRRISAAATPMPIPRRLRPALSTRSTSRQLSPVNRAILRHPPIRAGLPGGSIDLTFRNQQLCFIEPLGESCIEGGQLLAPIWGTTSQPPQNHQAGPGF